MQPQAQRKRRNPNGGGLRAYISKRCRLGHRGRIDFGQMGVDYRALPPEERAEVDRAGQEALRLHRAGVAKPFGVPASVADRELAVAHRRKQREALVTEVTRELQVARAGESSTALQLFKPDCCLSMSVRAPFTEMMAEAMSQLRAARLEDSVVEEAYQTALEEFSADSTKGVQSLALFQGGAASSGLTAQDFSARGTTSSGLHFADFCSDALGTAAKCVGIHPKGGIGSLMAAKLDAWWQASHQQVKDDRCNATGGMKERRPCHESGFCLCSPAGCRIEHFVRAAYGAVKARFQATSPAASDFLGHRVTVLFESRPRSCDAPRPNLAADIAPDSVVQEWRHAALVYRKPYRITWQVLQLGEESSDSTSVVRAEACNVWQTMYEFAFSLDLDRQWSVRFFCLGQSSTLLRRFTPKTIVLEPLAPSKGIVFWDGNDGPNTFKHPWAVRSSKHKASAMAAGQEEDADDTPGEDSDDAEDADDADPDELEDDWVQELQDPAALVAQAPSEHGAGVAVAGVGEPSAEPPPGGEMAIAAASSAEGNEARKMGEAEVIFLVPGGHIAYYKKGDRFYGYCDVPSHGKLCRIERTARAGRRKGQGRPLGLIMAWLACGGQHDTQKQHLNNGRWQSHADRVAARTALEQIGGSAELLQFEAGYKDGERGEPEEVN